MAHRRSRLTISALIGIAEAVALVIILAVGAVAFWRTLVVARRVERFAGEQFPDTLLLAQIAQGHLEVDRAINAEFALPEGPPELREELDGDIEIAFAAVDEGMKSYASRPHPAASGAGWREVAEALERWRQAAERFLEVSHPGAPLDPDRRASLHAWQRTRDASQDAERALLSYQTKVAAEVQQVRQESTSSTRIALWLIGLSMLAGALGHLAAARLLRRSVVGTVTTVVAEARRLEEAVGSGQLDVRGDPTGVGPEFQAIVEGMNETLDAFVRPLRLTARHIDRIARGDIPEGVPGEYHGEFEVIRQNLNQCIADLQTNRKRLAEAQKQLIVTDRLSTIGTLAAGLAHELNNPLAAVASGLSYLSEEVPVLLEATRRDPGDAALPQRAAEVADVLAEAREAARRVAAIVRDLGTVARLQPAATTRVSLPEILEAALALASGEIKAGVRVVRDMGQVPPVMADEAQLQRVFLHLIVNAAKAIAAKPSGEGEIALALRVNTSGSAVVELRDDGPGIEPAVREHIFKPFFSTRSPGAGTGLGLAVCHGIVLGLGGHIDVESEPGHGALFRVILPAAPAEECRRSGP